VAMFIMMMQLEYYRREVRLHESTIRLREHASEIKLIKDNMDSGLMLLDLELKVRPNFSDMCVKLLHKKKLKHQYFPKLVRHILEENQYFINTMNYGNDPEGDDYAVGDLDEWEKRVENYFKMIETEGFDEEELAHIDPLKYIKIYSYEGRSYISFHVSPIKVQNQIQYFMILISNDTGKVAGRYRIMEQERKYLEQAQLLFALSPGNPTEQLPLFHSFSRSYLELCKNLLTEARNTIPPQDLIKNVARQLGCIHEIFGQLNLGHYRTQAETLLQKCQDFGQIELEHSGNVMIINKSTQGHYIQLVVDCERFLHEIRPLFTIATFFIREPHLADELQKQKQALHYGLSQDTLQSDSASDFYDTQLSPDIQMFISLYTAFEMLLNQHDLQQDLERVEEKFKANV
ncbi:MAG: hypothetical protein AAF975_04735, partial [Spirochaetota bacterium]